MVESSRIDPREAIISERLAGIGRIVGVGGGKGGIGKSISAACLGIALADRGQRVGIFDLDFTSPSIQVVFGVEPGFPEEEFGIDPFPVKGISLMSTSFFVGDNPAPLRGVDSTNALIELLAITRWGDMDYLILDLPPGLGDTGLDVIRLMPRIEMLVVASASRMVTESVRRAVRLLNEQHIPLVGMVENMSLGESRAVEKMAEKEGVLFLGSVPYDSRLESSLGDVDLIRKTDVYRAWVGLAARL